MVYNGMEKGIVRVSDGMNRYYGIKGIVCEITDPETNYTDVFFLGSDEPLDAYLKNHSKETIAGEVAKVIEGIREDKNPMKAMFFESALCHADKEYRFEKDYEAYHKDFLAKGQQEGKPPLGEYLSSLQISALNHLFKDIHLPEYQRDVALYDYEERPDLWNQLAEKACLAFDTTRFMPRKPLTIHVTSTPRVSWNEPDGTLSMDASFDGRKDNILKYNEEKGQFTMSVMEPGPKLRFYPVPVRSTIHFPDGTAIPVVYANEQQKLITNGIMEMEQGIEQHWKPDNTVTITLSPEEISSLGYDNGRPLSMDPDLRESVEEAVHFAIQHGPRSYQTAAENLRDAILDAKRMTQEESVTIANPKGYSDKVSGKIVAKLLREEAKNLTAVPSKDPIR